VNARLRDLLITVLAGATIALMGAPVLLAQPGGGPTPACTWTLENGETVIGNCGGLLPICCERVDRQGNPFMS